MPVLHTAHLLLVPKTLDDVRTEIAQMDSRDKAQLSPDWLARVGAATTDDPWVLGFSTHVQVRGVRAHTMEESTASARVLTKCGFVPRGRVIDPDDGPVWRWEIEKEM